MAPNKRAREPTSNHAQHGKRRKFDNLANSTPADIERSLKQYMHHAVKLMHKHIKKARTFETQKLSRKVKQTKEPKDDKPIDDKLVKRLELELTSLKNLSIDKLASQVISSRTSKLSFLKPYLSTLTSSTPTLTNVEQPTKQELDPTTTEGKVRNRVLANKIVKQGWDEINKGLMKRCGINEEGTSQQQEAQEQQEQSKGIQINPDRLKRIQEDEDKKERRATKKQQLGTASDDVDEDDEESQDSDQQTQEGLDDSVIDDDEVERELARLNGGNDDETGSSEGEWSDSDDDDAMVAGSDEDDQDDNDQQENQDDLPVKTKRQRDVIANVKPTKQSTKPTKMASSSTFLPSLAAGYISYSDSDDEDAKWIKQDERQDKKQRKNRRGQRARQAIWEKKYGSGAKHIAKQLGTSPALTKQERDKLEKSKQKKQQQQSNVETFDPKNAPGGSTNPNAIQVDDFKKRRRTVTYESSGKMLPVVAVKAAEATAASNAQQQGSTYQTNVKGGWQQRNTNKEVKSLLPQAKSKPRVEEGMHPSWEAKRRAQEALQAVATAPKGKKIVFD
ncbi:hypothetical protein OIO90_001008 [Microbotryomycetes sp. JL221]|nr:hypothetical protein OIO90_001008 [Microbotryomycetes sp. JL221]